MGKSNNKNPNAQLLRNTEEMVEELATIRERQSLMPGDIDHSKEIAQAQVALQALDEGRAQSTPESDDVLSEMSRLLRENLGQLCNEVSLTLPIEEVPETNWGLHIDTRLTPKQSKALRGIAVGLDRKLCTLANGSRVVSTNDALKYLLEQVA